MIGPLRSTWHNSLFCALWAGVVVAAFYVKDVGVTSQPRDVVAFAIVASLGALVGALAGLAWSYFSRHGYLKGPSADEETCSIVHIGGVPRALVGDERREAT